jgi:predicted transcriptional regulator
MRERIFDEKTRTSFALDADMRSALERMADARGESVSAVIRAALDDRITAFEHGLPVDEREGSELVAS